MRECGSERNQNGVGRITIEGTDGEMDLIRSMMAGARWLRLADNGVLESIDRFAKLPDPTEDPLIPPKWALKVPPVGLATEKDIEASENAVRPSLNVREEFEPGEGWHSPSFYVEHLCGYGFTKERYKTEAKKLTAVGFECLRSRRGADGRYWEVWYLPFAIAAKGKLMEAVDAAEKRKGSWRDVVNAVVDWLIRNVAFGSLNVSVQRAAMTIG